MPIREFRTNQFGFPSHVGWLNSSQLTSSINVQHQGSKDRSKGVPPTYISWHQFHVFTQIFSHLTESSPTPTNIGCFLHREKGYSAFTSTSDNFAVVWGNYLLQFQLTVMKTWHRCGYFNYLSRSTLQVLGGGWHPHFPSSKFLKIHSYQQMLVNHSLTLE